MRRSGCVSGALISKCPPIRSVVLLEQMGTFFDEPHKAFQHLAESNSWCGRPAWKQHSRCQQLANNLDLPGLAYKSPPKIKGKHHRCLLPLSYRCHQRIGIPTGLCEVEFLSRMKLSIQSIQVPQAGKARTSKLAHFKI